MVELLLRHFIPRTLLLLCLLMPIFDQALAQPVGSITGRVIDERSREPLFDVNVVVEETTIGAATDRYGNYTIERVPPGVYTVTFTLVGYTTRAITGVVVRAGVETTLNAGLGLAILQVGEVEVYGASFRRERITEAPASVGVVEARDFRVSGSHGQLPKLLEHEAGVDIVQSGIFDFNINARGFNSSLTRRLLVLLDGRDMAVVFLGAQEWNGLSVPIEDLGRMELVRGPGSALYGANAFNGVINIVTPSPRDVVGTKVTLAGGELNTFRGDIRHANASGPWAYRVNFGRFQGNTWSRSRLLLPFEYDGFNPFLNVEVVPISDRKVASSYGSARVDYDFSDGSFITTEGGLSQVENEIYVTGIGRVQVTRAQKPWGRVSYNTEPLNVQIWASGRNSKEPQISLSTGLPLHERSATIQGDLQYRFSFAADRLRTILGASFRYQTIDTKGTLMQKDRVDNMSGLSAQFEYMFSEQLKAIAAARWDRSTLHSSQVSPKAALVWSPHRSHSLRATYNQAFQAPNYSELFLYVLHPVRALAYLGNQDLNVEKITGYEIGYKGILHNALFVTADVYFNRLKDFITDLAPGVNPRYRGQEIIDGVLRTVWSYGNAGRVDEFGGEFSANYYVSNEWLLSANYSYFGFDILEKDDNDVLIPNAPRHKVNAAIGFTSAVGLDVSVKVKYIPAYDWAAGIYQGKILPYAITDAAASYAVTENFSVGLNVSNLFDRKHYQIFGGSLLGRRAIVSVTATF